MSVTRHVIRVGNRDVHLRRSGEGPPVILLHASPVSSAMFPTQLDVFARAFTVIALDTPGYGGSDLLPSRQPEIADFADALGETLDALGISAAAFYGRHTGAGIGLEFAGRHPARARIVLCDGYPMFSAASRNESLERYLIDFRPLWDGSHLPAWWARFREQHVFWPWYRHQAPFRADQDMPDLAYLQRGYAAVIESGENYKSAYAAAFRHEGARALNSVDPARVILTARPGDSLLRVFESYPANFRRELLPRETPEATEVEFHLLRPYAQGATPPPPRAFAPDAGGTLRRGFVATPKGQLSVVTAGAFGPDRLPLVIVPPLPGSAALIIDEIMELARARPVIALTPLGHGDFAATGDHAMAGQAKVLLAGLDSLKVGRFSLLGMGSGAVLAVELARFCAERCAGLVLDDPLLLTPALADAWRDRYAPDIEPEWDGSHTLRLWHHLRDQQLWFPWFARTRTNARKAEPAIEAPRLHRHAVECLKHTESYSACWQQILFSDPLGALQSLAVPRLVNLPEDGLYTAHLVANEVGTAEKRSQTWPRINAFLNDLK